MTRVKNLVWAMAMVCAAAPLWADDFKTKDGVVHSGDVLKVEADGIKLTTETGIEKIAFTSLPADIQAKYGYDPAKAAAFAKTVAAAKHAAFVQNQIAEQSGQQRALEQDAERKNHVQAATVQQAKADAAAAAQAADQAQAQAVANLPRVSLYGPVLQKLDDGLLLEDATRGTIFLKGYPKEDEVVDNDNINARAALVGQYAYESVTGAKRTVRMYYVPPNR